MPDLAGVALYLLGLGTLAGIYAVMSLGLNIQWGMAGVFNAGIVAFFAVGAYASAILTTPAAGERLVGAPLPVPIGLGAAMVLAAALGWLVGRICIRLAGDYLAMATIGIAEMLRLVVRNEAWLTNGSLGIRDVPRPFDSLSGWGRDAAFAGLILAAVLGTWLVCRWLQRLPWGRTLRAIRDNPAAAAAFGKDVDSFRLQAFALGAAFMGLAGALFAHHVRYLGPDAMVPLVTTFLVWVMLIIGGSGNSLGAILGAVLVYAIWSGTELLAGAVLPADWQRQVADIRIFLIGLMLVVVLQVFPGGLLPERGPRPRRERPAEAPGAAPGIIPPGRRD